MNKSKLAGVADQFSECAASGLDQVINYKEIFNPSPKGTYVVSSVYRRENTPEPSVTEMIKALRNPDYSLLFSLSSHRDQDGSHGSRRK